MARAASDHVDDQGPSGATGHDGSDGSKPWDRVSRYGSWDLVVGENLSYGPDKAATVVMALIREVWPGVRSRRVHRPAGPAISEKWYWTIFQVPFSKTRVSE